MKLELRIACIALLAAMAAPAWAIQLGQIQVKSALNQPLVASIPLHPDNLSELEGLTVQLAPAEDFDQAGLQLTPTDQTLKFHVVTDNNGQKLILVTSSQPITDPYLDFLVQVNTREGRQVREFVVLLNPVVSAPAPEVREAVPAASAPAVAAQPQQLPPSSAFPPQPPAPATAAPPTTASPAGGAIPVVYGDTLFALARQQVAGTDISINQMMLALKAANPEAFFRDDINSLRAGAILRIPTRAEIDQTSLADANAEVHRQYAAWRASHPQRATLVEGAAAEAAATAAPRPGAAEPTSDRLALVPPGGSTGEAGNRPGVAGGTGTETVAGLRQQLHNDRDALVSIDQSNADLASRARSLEDIADKSGKLLALKEATIAELQHKLATLQAGKPVGAPAPAVAPAGATAPQVAAKTAAPAAARMQSAKPAPSVPWFQRPLAWIIAVLVVLALIVIGLRYQRRRGADSGARGPLADPNDIAATAEDTPSASDVQADSGEGTVDAGPGVPLNAAPEPETIGPPFAVGWRPEPARRDHAPAAGRVMPHDGDHEATPVAAARVREPYATGVATAPPPFIDDPVDTKLDLARAYLDMGDLVGARTMLAEVLEEGSQTQKDEANRLLVEVAG